MTLQENFIFDLHQPCFNTSGFDLVIAILFTKKKSDFCKLKNLKYLYLYKKITVFYI